MSRPVGAPVDHVKVAEAHLARSAEVGMPDAAGRYHLAAAGVHGLLALVAAVRALREDAS